MTESALVLLLGLTLGAAGGCGETLIPGEQTEIPMLTLQGGLVGAQADLPLRVTALWVDPLGQRDDWPSEAPVASGRIARDGALALDFFVPPPAHVIRRIPSFEDPTRAVFAFALAEIVVFEDRDGDGRFAVTPLAAGSTMVPPDAYRAAAGAPSGGDAVIYVEQPRRDDSNVIPELDPILTQERGYHRALIACPPGGLGGATTPPVADQPVMLVLGPASGALPQPRACLRAHPSAEDP